MTNTIRDERLNRLCAEKHELIRKYERKEITSDKFLEEIKRIEAGLNRLRFDLEALDRARRKDLKWTKNAKIDFYTR